MATEKGLASLAYHFGIRLWMAGVIGHKLVVIVFIQTKLGGQFGPANAQKVRS